MRQRRVWSFAWRSLVRQPGRALLGMCGIAAIGALLFDMLLLSRGLIVSFRALLESAGFDVRVSAGQPPVTTGPRIAQAGALVTSIRSLPAVEEAIAVRFGQALATAPDGQALELFLTGADPGRRRPWILLEGRDLGDHPGTAGAAVVINRNLARRLAVGPGAQVRLRGDCSRDPVAVPPVMVLVSGIAAFPFDDPKALTAAASLGDFQRVCGSESADEADLVLVTSRGEAGPTAAVQAIRALRPDLHAYTNEEMVAHFQRVGFSYFQQISAVLSTITVFFGFLLVTVLLTVSVNQRLGEIAALRALGFTRSRVIWDVLAQAVLVVGAGGFLSLPLGLALSRWLETILHAMPEIPSDMHFFVFEPRTLVLHGAVLTLTALLAALYPMRLVARLPIAATLRRETIN
jgi:ABC-type lipoprotein release transport system permease subunit